MPDKRKAVAVRAALARGDLLAAYDQVRLRAENSSELDYLEVLTLARLGDTVRGLQLYNAYGLGEREDADALALNARLLKDAGFGSGGELDIPLLEGACDLYESIYRRTGDPYPAVNAATLARMIGRDALAKELAEVVVSQPGAEAARDYYSQASLVEAWLVLGDLERARAALQKALRAKDADFGKRSTTAIQLQRLAPVLGVDFGVEELAALIGPPAVATYRGHMFLAKPGVEARLATRIRVELEAERVGFVYGSLAGGSDILFAEQALALGIELHVVLPVTEADFIKQAVAPTGPSWVARYEACRDAATSVTFASTMSHVGGQGQFAYGSKVAMGMARLRARHLHGDVLQMAIMGAAAGPSAQARSDLRAWQAKGGRSVVIETEPLPMPPAPAAPTLTEVARGTYGLMFTDFPGFARLDERALPLFNSEVMARAAISLRDHTDAVLHKNTWGDAVYVVFSDILACADAALELCKCLQDVDPGVLGLRQNAAMRIALHYGPTYSGIDPVTERTTFYGSEVSRAARIEPVTPPGSVYVTEPFAAVLEMEPGHAFACDYVGRVELPKGYGTFPLYRLRRG